MCNISTRGGFTLWDLSWMTLFLLTMAVYRLTRLIVFDQITSFIRHPFLDESFEVDENGLTVAVIEEKGGPFHTFMRNLLTCYWCVGVWSSIAIVLAYWFIPVIAFPFILILALAGVAGIIESFVKG